MVLFGKLNTALSDCETIQHLFNQIEHILNTTVSNDKQYFTM